MRSITFIALFVLNSGISFAQKGFYIKPEGGIGVTNSNINMGPDRASITAYNGVLNVGCSFNKIRVGTGLGYLQTGYKIEKNVIHSNIPPYSLDSGSISYIHNHIILPLNVSYNISITKRLNFIPQIGIAISYNNSRVAKYDMTVKKDKEAFPKNTFHSVFRPFSLFGSIQMNIEYAISKNIALSVAPVFHKMLTNQLSYKQPRQYDYNASINLGCTIRLQSKPGEFSNNAIERMK